LLILCLFRFGEPLNPLSRTDFAEPPRVRGERPRQGTGPPPDRPVPVGTYRIVLTVDGVEQSQTLKVRPDPIAPTAPDVLEDEEEMDKPSAQRK